jgi:signal transduction histidine kinase
VSPYFTHPAILALWSLAIATFAIFGMLTLGNVYAYRVLRQPDVRVHIGFTTFGTLLALSVALSFLPMGALLKSQIFRLMWISGSAGLGFWIWSLVTFARCDSAFFVWLRRGFFAVAGIITLDLVVAAATGWSAFYALQPLPTESIALLASGNVMRYRGFGEAVAGLTILMTLTTSVVLLRTLIKKRRTERLLMFGVTLTPVFACLEVGLVVTGSSYSMPLLFIAKLVEAARISWYTRDRLVQELNDVRAAQQDQAALLEAQLRQLELNSSLAKVGQRTAELSHDMRNPLTTVVVTVDLIEAALSQNPPDAKEALELAASMRGALDHVLELVRRITRQASESVAPQRQVSVERVVSNALALCQERLVNTTVTVHVPSDLRVKGWATELTQVLVNLISNSCDALEGHAAAWIRIDAEVVEGRLQLRVADAGRRPPTAIIDKMFVTRFTTGKTTASTGLGLTICSQIVRLHQGTIAVDERSPNTTIVIELPHAQRSVHDAA